MEPFKALKYRSITFRMTLAFSLFLIVFQTLLALTIYHYIKNGFKETIILQQQTLLNVIAQNLDQKLQASSSMIVDVSRQITPGIVSDPDSAQRFLDNRPGTHSVFDNGLFLFSLDGKIIAESPFKDHRRGRDISFREYFIRTVSSRKPVISDPYVSTHTPGAPAIMFTAPVVDSQGNLLAVLGGSLNLLHDNFLGELSRTKIASTGYLYIINRDRAIIMHPDRSRIMQNPELPGRNLLLDKALGGFEGGGENVNSRGLRSLTSFKHLKNTGWILGANYPIAEAYSPITTFRNYLIGAIILSVFVSIFIVRMLMVKFTLSLVAFADHVRNIAGKKNSERKFLSDSSDEIGILVQVFNTMIEREDQRSKELIFASTHDSMTGLYNRAYFDSELERLSKGRITPVSIVVADIDGLKLCNDMSGHAAGDELIRAAAQILKDSFRGEDIIARIGGDEFGVILPGMDRQQTAAAIDRVKLCEAGQPGVPISATHSVSCTVQISLGCATCDSPDNLFEAFRQADREMYVNKSARRNSSPEPV